MLTSQPKSRRRRRRRRKQSMPAPGNTASSSNLDVDEPITEFVDGSENKHSFSPKVNVKFINEEAEIETAMLIKQFNKDTDFQTKQKERAIEFFTSGLSSHEVDDMEKLEEETIDEIQTKRDESLDVMPTPSSVPTNYPDDGPQFASSYLNENFDNVVIPFERETIVFDIDRIYFPNLVLTKQLSGDVEAAAGASLHAARNVVNEGYFVRRKPQILQINRAQFINRLITEGAFYWLDGREKEVKGLIDIVISNRLIKTFCAEEFHPIEYPVTSVYSLFDAFALHDRILKIHLKSICFDAHPMFNPEQKLAKELETLYDEYSWRTQNDICGNIETKLDVLRQLLNTVSRSNSLRTRKKSQMSMIDNFRAYRDELIELRAMLHRERIKDRKLIQSILEKWAELKKQREKQGVQSTFVKLLIKIQKPNPERDEQEWNYNFNVELSEMIQEAKDLYREQKHQRKLEAKETINDIDTEEKETLPKLSKPDSGVIEQQLFELYTNSMRPPGEEIVVFELEKSAVVSDKNLPKYVVRLLLDNEQLDFPDSTRLSGIGQVYFNAVFSIKFTTKLPTKLKFQIYEKHALHLGKKVAEINPIIPHESEIFELAPMTVLTFTESQQATTKNYTGKIWFNIGWSSLVSDSNMKVSISQAAIVDRKMNETINALSDELIDPMDPENTTLATIIQNSGASVTAENQNAQMLSAAKRKDIFRLNEDLYAFCARDKLNDNKRIEMLNARFNSDLKLKDCKLIPHNEIEIEIPTDLKIFEDMLWVDPIDVQRYQGKKYLKHVYDIITNHCEVINRNYEHRDLLIGDTPPTLYGAIEALTNMFSPRRPLNPNRKTGAAVRKPNFHEDSVHRFNIIVNVVRASGIPFRNSTDTSATHRRTSFGSAMQSCKNIFFNQQNTK